METLRKCKKYKVHSQLLKPSHELFSMDLIPDDFSQLLLPRHEEFPTVVMPCDNPHAMRLEKRTQATITAKNKEKAYHKYDGMHNILDKNIDQQK